MVRNGRAKVEVTFTEEAACTALHTTCRINSECCSKKCAARLCVPDGDAAERSERAASARRHQIDEAADPDQVDLVAGPSGVAVVVSSATV